jgi:hypothetical protein
MKELRNARTFFSSLRQIAFASALSFVIMMETDKIDLSPAFDVLFVDCGCTLDFPGYAIEAVHGANDMINLVKVPHRPK